MNARVAMSSNFWEFKLAHLLIILPFILGAAGFFVAYGQWKGNQERDIREMSNNAVKVTETLERLSEKVQRIDSSGSQYSQFIVQKFNNTIAENERRTLNNEKTLGEMGPKVERIDTNLTWITQWIQAQEAVRKNTNNNARN